MPPVEVLEVEAARTVHGHFNVIHGPTSLRADVYVADEDPLHAWGLAARRALSIVGVTIWIAPPEYVIVRKLQYAAQGGGEATSSACRSAPTKAQTDEQARWNVLARDYDRTGFVSHASPGGHARCILDA